MSQLNLVRSTPVHLRRETPWFGSNPWDICTAHLLDPPHRAEDAVRPRGRSSAPSTPRLHRPTLSTVCANRSDAASPSCSGPGLARPNSHVVDRFPPRAPGVDDREGTMTLSRATIPRPAIGSVTDAKASSTHDADDPEIHRTAVMIPTWRTSTHPLKAFGGWTPKKMRSPGVASFRSSTGSAKWCCSCTRRGMNTGRGDDALANAA